ncbi:MAG: hypothetical protein H8M99_14790 [Gloeobacteraceae cyanobacterium ES-bin-144]|nr:hypothetical protein [Verrucomicrobiales bacterium]
MDLTLAEFVLMVVFGSSAMVVAFTIISRTLHARSESRSLAHRVICRLCLHAYEDRSHVKVLDCPACGAKNEKGRSRRLG